MSTPPENGRVPPLREWFPRLREIVEKGRPPQGGPARELPTPGELVARAERIIEMVKDRQVLTVGHSSHAWESFAEMLRRHQVTDLVDVRSNPYSRFAVWAKQDFLKTYLPSIGVRYHFFGHELGGNPLVREVYDLDGHLDHTLVRQTDFYRAGLARLLALIAQGGRFCLMCAEGKPDNCHRKTLIAPDLVAAQIQVSHIQPPTPPKPSEGGA